MATKTAQFSIDFCVQGLRMLFFLEWWLFWVPVAALPPEDELDLEWWLKWMPNLNL